MYYPKNLIENKVNTTQCWSPPSFLLFVTDSEQRCTIMKKISCFLYFEINNTFLTSTIV